MGPPASRRRALELTGLTLAAALPGCASVADRFSSGSDPGDSDSNSSAGNAVARGDSSTDDPTSSGSANESSASDEPLAVTAPDVSFADAPLPDDPGAHPYARMGTGADVTATAFGNWKCPYTRAMVVEYLPSVVSTFVRPGDIDLEFRFLAYRSGDPFLGADAPRATRAGLAVWDDAPESYWSYFSHVFANQPSSDERWATPTALGHLADAAGANGSLDDRLDADDARLDRTVAAARERSVYSVPRLVVDGEVFAPTIEPAITTDALAAATK
ncbi:DsbA family protein [Natronoarchaeum rubrum]|uniref:DsbA family protein n=1 Tax=Natronoarchaeum rubrum TaxID=755311 RepID=UPI002112A723|nr:thioredoxin domain-containing protein [Natronoarchaeum rubrum]